MLNKTNDWEEKRKTQVKDNWDNVQKFMPATLALDSRPSYLDDYAVFCKIFDRHSGFLRLFRSHIVNIEVYPECVYIKILDSNFVIDVEMLVQALRGNKIKVDVFKTQ